MSRFRLAIASLGLAVAASTIGVTAVAAPANASLIGCVGSTLNLVTDLKHDALHAVGLDLRNITALVGALVTDVATLNLTAIQGQAEAVVTEAAQGLINVSQKTLNDAEAVLAACTVS